jgi:hypothetical protein
VNGIPVRGHEIGFGVLTGGAGEHRVAVRRADAEWPPRRIRGAVGAMQRQRERVLQHQIRLFEHEHPAHVGRIALRWSVACTFDCKYQQTINDGP